MKVLEIVGEPIANGGQESFIFNVLATMNQKNLTIDVLTPYEIENQFYRSSFENNGGKVYSLGFEFKNKKSRFKFFLPLLKHIKNNDYDVIHVHSGSILSLVVSALASKVGGVKKIVVHSHCAVEKKNLKNRLLRCIASPLFKISVTDYYACSKLAGEAKFSNKIVNNQLKILKNGVDLEKFKYNSIVRKSMRNKLMIDDNDVVIGHVGRFSYQKNHEFLIEIINRYLKDNINSRLVLIGSGEEMLHIKDLCINLGINDKVIFVGNVSNVYDYFQAFDVFLLPSRFEGLPIVGIEAQASGLNCLVSDAVSTELNITNSIKFLSIDSVDDWIKELKKIKCCSRADNSEKIIKSGYDIKSTAEDLRNLYIK